MCRNVPYDTFSITLEFLPTNLHFCKPVRQGLCPRIAIMKNIGSSFFKDFIQLVCRFLWEKGPAHRRLYNHDFLRFPRVRPRKNTNRHL